MGVPGIPVAPEVGSGRKSRDKHICVGNREMASSQSRGQRTRGPQTGKAMDKGPRGQEAKELPKLARPWTRVPAGRGPRGA